MAINSTDTKRKTSGDGATLTFSFPFKIFQNTDIVVQKIDKDTDVATTLTLGTDYTVSINTITEGGTITISVAKTPSANEWVFIYSNLPFTQTVVLPTDGAFREISVSNGMDRLCRLIQQVKERADRAVVQRADVTAVDVIIPVPESLKLIGWNEAGTGLENKVPVDADVVTAAQTALEQAEEAQAAAEAAQVAAEEARDAAEVIAGWEVANQEEAEVGTDNTKVMTPLRVKQSIIASEQHFIINDTKPANTAGGTFTSGAWRTRDLNTEVYNTITGAITGNPGDVILLHMDGSDDGTTFTDSYSRHTPTPTNVVTKTAVQKFGTASAYFDGTSGRKITIPESNDFGFGTGDFTIDFWIRNSTQSTQPIFGLKNDGVSWGIIFNGATAMQFYTRGYGAEQTWVTTSRNNDEWYHMAFVRHGNDLIYFQNGVSQGTKTISGEMGNAGDVVMGYWSEWGSLSGYIDELRISKGIARWTENFTPEVAAYDADDEYTLNAITLPAGTYLINASAPVCNVLGHMIKLRNITDGTDTLFGSSGIALGSGVGGSSFLVGSFTIEDTTVFEIQHVCGQTGATTGFGSAVNLESAPEMYTQVHITKVG